MKPAPPPRCTPPGESTNRLAGILQTQGLIQKHAQGVGYPQHHGTSGTVLERHTGDGPAGVEMGKAMKQIAARAGAATDRAVTLQARGPTIHQGAEVGGTALSTDLTRLKGTPEAEATQTRQQQWRPPSHQGQRRQRTHRFENRSHRPMRMSHANLSQELKFSPQKNLTEFSEKNSLGST